MQKINGFYLSIWSITLICSPVIFAGGMGPKSLEHTPGYFELIGAGSLSAVIANNGQLGVTSDEIDTLVGTNRNAWNFWGGQLGLGYVYFLFNAQKYSDNIQWLPRIEPELNVYYSSYTNAGDIYRFGSSAFNSLTYTIPVDSTRLMFDGALTVASWRQISAYLIGGLGNAWNRIGYRDEVKNTLCNVENLNLNNNSSSNFVWEAGAGLAYDINKHIAISFEYLYTNFGTLNTSVNGNIDGITTPLISPASFNLATQGLLLGLHIAA
jgi:outer membrane autotransporter protein